MPTHDSRNSSEPKDRVNPLGVHAARVGTLVKEKWRLDRLLGIGGMASVYAATHRNGKRVAIKMLHEEHARNMDVRARFLREGYVANAVDHDGVVSILDDDMTEDGVVFLVMELLEGETIERRWERKGRRLPVGEALWLASELLDILAAAHAKGVVHRDIKPENIFLSRSESGGKAAKIKVLDFGIARLRQLSSSASTTQSGTTMGTPAFMSPEQARGRWDEVDGRSDLWAVGATLFTLLAGRFVHEAATPNEQLLAAMTGVAPPIGSVLPDLAPDVASVIDRALAHRAVERWESARAMQAAIHAAAAARAPVKSAPSDPDKTEAMTALDADSIEAQADGGETSEAIEQGVANAPSAAPEVRVVRRSRSPYVVGVSAGALGVVIGLTALLHDPTRARSVAAASAPAAPLAVVALSQPAEEVVVTETVTRTGDAGLADVAHGAPLMPAPPATGVPASMAVETLPVPHHIPAVAVAVASAAAPAPPPEPSAAPSTAEPTPAPDPSARSDGSLDRGNEEEKVGKRQEPRSP